MAQPADEADFLELLIASERVEEWLEVVQNATLSDTRLIRALKDMLEAVIAKEAYVEEVGTLKAVLEPACRPSFAAPIRRAPHSLGLYQLLLSSSPCCSTPLQARHSRVASRLTAMLKRIGEAKPLQGLGSEVFSNWQTSGPDVSSWQCDALCMRVTLQVQIRRRRQTWPPTSLLPAAAARLPVEGYAAGLRKSCPFPIGWLSMVTTSYITQSGQAWTLR